MNTTQRYDKATDRDYKEALARLDLATLSDDQMLSSFKRGSLTFRRDHADQAEILRHGKHANQSSGNAQQTAPSSSKKTRDQPQTQHQAQPQQAAYYNNDMPGQGLTAANGECIRVQVG